MEMRLNCSGFVDKLQGIDKKTLKMKHKKEKR
jgi:hypothetical protein